MAWRINQVKNILLSLVFVFHLDGVRFDRNPSLPFQIHIVQQLILLFSGSYCSGKVQQAIGKGAFAMVDVGDDAKIPNVFHSLIFLCKAKILILKACFFV